MLIFTEKDHKPGYFYKKKNMEIGKNRSSAMCGTVHSHTD